MNEMRKNNQVTVIGEVVSTFNYSHKVHGEAFYTVMLSMERESGVKDVIPVMMSERLMDVTQDYRGNYLKVQGEYRSFDRYDTRKLDLNVFALEAEDAEPSCTARNNEIILCGTICKEPIYRKTPLDREIAEILLAVNRPYGKSDYIPCIIWGRNARYAGNLKVGTKVRATGRIQSREYKKTLPDGTEEIRTAYEASISLVEEEDGR